MNTCAICGQPICNHGKHRVSGSVWTCLYCNEFGINGHAPIYCLPMYEGKVTLVSDTYFTVCKECHDTVQL